VNLGLPPAQRILVLAPHPDDESLSCGGTIVRYVRDGAVVSLLVVSDGAAIEEPDGYHEDVVAIRRQELTAAAAVLGISQLHELELPDGQLVHHPGRIQEAIRAQLADFRPDLVLAPSPIDGHSDHVTVGRITLQLFRETPGWTLAFYEGLAPLRFNWLVEITEVAPLKEKAIHCYQRSLFQQPTLFWEAFHALNVAKSAFVHRPGLFEALWVLHTPPTDYEIIEWATYGFQPHDNGQPTLRTVQQIDELLFALQEKATTLADVQKRHDALQRENTELQRQLHEQVAVNSALRQTVESRTQGFQQERSQFSLKFPLFLRHHVERAFPTGSPRRAVLDAVKRRIIQYTSKSPSE
jgi:N-acetylglucosamine malate deacetylase 1